MCHAACLDFGARQLTPAEVDGREVLEVGALDVNGSLRGVVQAMQPRRYLGVDLRPGPGVDEICDACDLLARFGEASFDLVVCTEMLEHVRRWREAVHNLKGVLRPGGVLLLTTRSRGFPRHDFPEDCWRFELADCVRIFADLEILTLESDREAPGVLLKALKPGNFREVDLADYAVEAVEGNSAS